MGAGPTRSSRRFIQLGRSLKASRLPRSRVPPTPSNSGRERRATSITISSSPSGPGAWRCRVRRRIERPWKKRVHYGPLTSKVVRLRTVSSSWRQPTPFGSSRPEMTTLQSSMSMRPEHRTSSSCSLSGTVAGTTRSSATQGGHASASLMGTARSRSRSRVTMETMDWSRALSLDFAYATSRSGLGSQLRNPSTSLPTSQRCLPPGRMRRWSLARRVRARNRCRSRSQRRQ